MIQLFYKNKNGEEREIGYTEYDNPDDIKSDIRQIKNQGAYDLEFSDNYYNNLIN